MRGGGDMEDRRPLRPDGHLHDDAIGCHRSHFDTLNIRNPTPGFTYYWASRRRGKVRAMQHRGYELVTSEMQERLEESSDPDLAAAGLDSEQARNDVVLMRCPVEKYAVYSAERERLALSRQHSAAEGSDFLNRGAGLRDQFGQGDRDIHFRRPDHSVTVEEG